MDRAYEDMMDKQEREATSQDAERTLSMVGTEREAKKKELEF